MIFKSSLRTLNLHFEKSRHAHDMSELGCDLKEIKQKKNIFIKCFKSNCQNYGRSGHTHDKCSQREILH